MATYGQKRNPYEGWGMAAGAIYIYLGLAFVGSAPAAWPGTPSYNCITFANGDNATAMGLR